MTSLHITFLWEKKWLKNECTPYKRVMIRSALNLWKWEWKSECTHFFANEWELSEAQKNNECWTRCSLIIEGRPDTLILRFTAKPFILWKLLFQWLCSKFYEFKHRHNFFWPQRSWRLLEAKNTSRRPKLWWRSWFFEKSN